MFRNNVEANVACRLIILVLITLLIVTEIHAARRASCFVCVCEYSIRIIELSTTRQRMYEAVLVVLNVSKFLPFVHYRNFPSAESYIK